MSDTRRIPLVMFPDGSLVRSEVVPEGCVLVVEPVEIESDMPPVIDQTQAVKEADSVNTTRT
jgi:hypothetical protein